MMCRVFVNVLVSLSLIAVFGGDCVWACEGCADSKVNSNEFGRDVEYIDVASSGDELGLTSRLLEDMVDNVSYVDIAGKINGFIDVLDDIAGLQSQMADNITAPNSPLYEVQPSPSKGLGIFAFRPIPSGTPIFIEAPIMAVPTPSMLPGVGFHLASMVPDLDASFASLSPSEQSTVMSLHDHRFPSEEEDGTSHLLTIFRSNAYNTGENEIGLFPKVARINHSCRPNAVNWWSERIGRRVIYATRDIAAGEEITVTYIPLLMGTEERQRRLVQYGFRCGCEVCEEGLEQSDERRVRIGEVLAELKALREGDFDDENLGKLNGNGMSNGVRARDETIEAAIRKAIRLVKWVEEEEGLGDYKAMVYRLAAWFNMRRGWLGAAEGWARKELGIWEWAERESEEVKDVNDFIESLKKLNWR